MKSCIQCSAPFVIPAADSEYYKNIHVPDPTRCPACRMQRRMAFRNERHLYKRKCDFSGKEIISLYPPTSRFTVYDQNVWWSDKWDVLKYGRSYDFSRPFFEQFGELLRAVPRISLQNRNNENSEYCNDTDDMKNCFLCFNAEQAEDCHYSNTFGYSRNSMDLMWCLNAELCYECTKVHDSYHSFWCLNGKNLSDCFFSEDCQSCQNCFGCVGLRQKKYCLSNEQLSKSEYEEFIKHFAFTHSSIAEVRKKTAELNLRVPHKNLQIEQSEDSTGDYISNSKRCGSCFDVMNSENSKYIWDGLVVNSYDCFNTGINSNFLYECVGVYNSNNVKFSHKCSQSSDILYSDYSAHSTHLFGCAGLRNKKFHILNKEYPEKEYFELLAKIMKHMESTREWGEFFPFTLSSVGYNDSMAQEYFPVAKEEALQKGFVWNDYVSPKMTGTKTLEASALPERIADVPDDVLNWAVECEKDEKPFKIIPPELEFYRTNGLPLPRLCPDCRHYLRKSRINPRKLWTRDCGKCGKSMETTYAPERPEIVYCEECYLGSVY